MVGQGIVAVPPLIADFWKSLTRIEGLRFRHSRPVWIKHGRVLKIQREFEHIFLVGRKAHWDRPSPGAPLIFDAEAGHRKHGYRFGDSGKKLHLIPADLRRIFPIRLADVALFKMYFPLYSFLDDWTDWNAAFLNPRRFV